MLTIGSGIKHMMWFFIFRHFSTDHDQLIFLAVKSWVIYNLFPLFNTASGFDLIYMHLVVFERFKFTKIHLKKLVFVIIVGESLVYKRGALDFHTFVRKINYTFLQWLESQRVFVVKYQACLLFKLQFS